MADGFVNGAVRATCSQCGHREEWEVPLGASIMRAYDKLLIWMRDEHQCEAVTA